ncbi:MAG: M15 family metallopeptidase [Clostridia bacterium]|nr:M15 family metallopeptidase [Clostridia bacterium]
MNQNGQGYPARRKPVRNTETREKSRTLKLLLLIALVLAIWILAIVGIVNLLKKDHTPKPAPVPADTSAERPGPAETLPPADTTAPAPVPDKNGLLFETKEVPSSGVWRGDLILVNKDHPYRFEENRETKIISLYTFRRDWPTSSYKLSNSSIELADFICERLSVMFDAFLKETGDNSYLLTSGWRDYEEQVKTVEEMIEKYGSKEEAMKYTASPGCSEHHTGMAFDTYIYTAEGAVYKPGAADMPAMYNWIYDNCARFGFVKRYDEEKKEITGISGESWHFRYVGAPHAALMGEKDYCLEEYIDFLHGFSYRDYLEYTDPEGGRYAIYYEKVENVTVVTPALTDAAGAEVAPPVISERFPEEAKLHLPKDLPCEISGDNESGIIITVKLS